MADRKVIPTPQQLTDPKVVEYLQTCVGLSNQFDKFFQLHKLDHGTVIVALGFLFSTKADSKAKAEKFGRDIATAILEAYSMKVVNEKGDNISRRAAEAR